MSSQLPSPALPTPLKGAGRPSGPAGHLLNVRGEQLGLCEVTEHSKTSWTLSWNDPEHEFPLDREISWIVQEAGADRFVEVEAGFLRVDAASLPFPLFMELFHKAAFHEPPVFYLRDLDEPKLPAGMVWFGEDQSVLRCDWTAAYMLRSRVPTLPISMDVSVWTAPNPDAPAPRLVRPGKSYGPDAGLWLRIRATRTFLGGPTIYKTVPTLEALFNP